MSENYTPPLTPKEFGSSDTGDEGLHQYKNSFNEMTSVLNEYGVYTDSFNTKLVACKNLILYLENQTKQLLLDQISLLQERESLLLRLQKRYARHQIKK